MLDARSLFASKIQSRIMQSNAMVEWFCDVAEGTDRKFNGSDFIGWDGGERKNWLNQKKKSMRGADGV